ncbi:FAD-dependent monooxygenase [Williamsia sterculiae]|uniref:2-polyprenyl-6-methoxyphenol hydroxylase n=1 Tax=Williamsia sterculiae TaxID=1344003 RepID=A0A1N7EZZ5_9NOCA|nr:FAD-dependent monooxygenase [Williamsia sterculiae]SIR93562.1 2-polyprenyl-6-methoxyphenol hydroxylase [Williamsia sterculiae]
MNSAVIVVGAGPVGLMLACELRLQGVTVEVIERLDAPVTHSKAFGLNARTMECLALRGLLEPMRERARHARVEQFGGAPAPSSQLTLAHFAGVRTVRIDDVDAAFGGMLGIQQSDVEAVLTERAVESGVRITRGVDLVDIEQDAAEVRIRTRTDGDRHLTMTADVVVGCDGGRSAVRTLTGFPTTSTPPTMTGRLAVARVPDLLMDPGAGWHRTGTGVIQVLPGRVIVAEFTGAPENRHAVVTADEVREAAERVVGRRVAWPTETGWCTGFTDHTLIADDYRHGRVLLAGDAAHVHSPFGGQGLNLGVQDAVNLGWKLAAWLHDPTAETLLDGYTTERRAVAARVLHNTRAQVALMNPDNRVTPLRELFTEMMDIRDVNQRLAAVLSSTDVRIPGSDPASWVGGFMPNIPITTADGTGGCALDFFDDGRWVLFDLGDDGEPHPTARHVVSGTPRPGYTGPARILVRPDGYVAWTSSADERGPDEPANDRCHIQ